MDTWLASGRAPSPPPPAAEGRVRAWVLVLLADEVCRAARLPMCGRAPPCWMRSVVLGHLGAAGLHGPRITARHAWGGRSTIDCDGHGHGDR